MDRYDAIVVGLGGAGAAAAYHLASAGLRTIGIEQFETVHIHGSSHGRSRIFRTAYSEGPIYVPMVQRAQQLWYALQERSHERIIQRTGGLIIGGADTRLVGGALRTATVCGLRHELLDPDAVRARFPQFALRDDEVAVWDPDAGALVPENCIRAHSRGALEAGAELHYGERVRRWAVLGDSVRVETTRSEYRGDALVITAGPWTATVALDLDLPLVIERQFMLWFPSVDRRFTAPERMPVFLWDRPPEFETYGVPDFGDGVKVGSWRGATARSPEEVDRVFRPQDAEPIRRFVSASLRGVSPREVDVTSCLYTNAPDHHFLIGRHPSYARVLVVSACSGHGFKFASVVGEIVTRLVLRQEPQFDLSPFDPARFAER